MSLQIVQNQQLKPIGDKVAIDTQLSTTSENAISNKVVTEEINQINSDLTGKLVVRQYLVTTGTYGQFDIPSLTGYRPISIETSDLMCLGIQNAGLLGSYSATLVTLDGTGKYVPSANNTIYINVVYAKI